MDITSRNKGPDLAPVHGADNGQAVLPGFEGSHQTQMTLPGLQEDHAGASPGEQEDRVFRSARAEELARNPDSKDLKAALAAEYPLKRGLRGD